ncbi:hypothetical protein NEISICOT_03334 [Neisseria sicca ATCC 29256]|uniref:Uncharacterized protein n=1 Tax=Neisseria sicca ATCC 29256 TaxID=547045 RepID=C6M9V3_NEISI|nr:hypothetical protein NEISICOT_03334 [Neisseria sicca ATCC 29256]
MVYAFSSSENFSHHDFPNAKVQQLKTIMTMQIAMNQGQNDHVSCVYHL